MVVIPDGRPVLALYDANGNRTWSQGGE
jgi:hypothetical protein